MALLIASSDLTDCIRNLMASKVFESKVSNSSIAINKSSEESVCGSRDSNWHVTRSTTDQMFILEQDGGDNHKNCKQLNGKCRNNKNIDRFLYIDPPCIESPVLETYSISQERIKYSVPKLLPVNESTLMRRRRLSQERSSPAFLKKIPQKSRPNEKIETPYISFKVESVKETLRNFVL